MNDMIDLQSYPASRFWMRSVSFVGLRNIIALVRQFPNGLAVREIVNLIREAKPFVVKSKIIPSNTTIYHYRNTLLRLGILVKHKNLLHLDWSNQNVLKLLNCLSEENQLTIREKQSFSQLVLNQSDCKAFFSDLFWPSSKLDYSLEEWLSTAIPVTWVEINPRESRLVQLRSWGNDRVFQLSSENHIQAILYGVRYWFRDELGLIDEMFKEDTGNVMFPILRDDQTSEQTVISTLLNSLVFDKEWARISIRELALSLCVKLRISIRYLFTIIRSLQKNYPGHILFIPTSRSFATITASSKLRENLELRSFFQDDTGVYISHLRIHQGIKEKVL